jgi:hypothetical protein
VARKNLRSCNRCGEDCFFSDYKENAGLIWPTKYHILHDGITKSRHEIIETFFVDKFDDREFAKP